MISGRYESRKEPVRSVSLGGNWGRIQNETVAYSVSMFFCSFLCLPGFSVGFENNSQLLRLAFVSVEGCQLVHQEVDCLILSGSLDSLSEKSANCLSPRKETIVLPLWGHMTMVKVKSGFGRRVFNWTVKTNLHVCHIITQKLFTEFKHFDANHGEFIWIRIWTWVAIKKEAVEETHFTLYI